VAGLRSIFRAERRWQANRWAAAASETGGAGGNTKRELLSLDHYFFFEAALATAVGLYHPAELAMRAAVGHAPAELEAARTTFALWIGIHLQLALQRGVLAQEIVDFQLYLCQLEQEVRDQLLEFRVPAPLADDSQAGREGHGTRNPRKQIAHATQYKTSVAAARGFSALAATRVARES